MFDKHLDRVEPLLRRWLRQALWLAVVLPAPAMVALLLLDELGANPIRELEHMSGEWALRFLIASLAVTPLIRLTGWGWLIAERKFLGLAAFVWAFLHLSVYTVLDWFFDWDEIWKDIAEHLYITLGMLAFVLMVPLALTSTKGAIRRMGAVRWKRLHALVYVSIVAACVHFMWAVKKDIEEPLMYAGTAAVVLGLRLLRRRSPVKSSSQ